MVGGVGSSRADGNEESKNNNTESRRSIENGNKAASEAKQANLEHARRYSIAILQTIRDANASEDPTLIDLNEQQRQIDEAIKIFETLGTDDNINKFDAQFWNDAFKDYNRRMVKQEVFNHQPYNRNYNNNNNNYNNNNNNNNLNGNNNLNDGSYNVNETRFVEIKEENHGIFDSIKSTENEIDENASSDELRKQIERLQRENGALKQQVNNLQYDNQLLRESKYELINNTSQAMQEYKFSIYLFICLFVVLVFVFVFDYASFGMFFVFYICLK